MKRERTTITTEIIVRSQFDMLPKRFQNQLVGISLLLALAALICA